MLSECNSCKAGFTVSCTYLHNWNYILVTILPSHYWLGDYSLATVSTGVAGENTSNQSRGLLLPFVSRFQWQQLCMNTYICHDRWCCRIDDPTLMLRTHLSVSQTTCNYFLSDTVPQRPHQLLGTQTWSPLEIKSMKLLGGVLLVDRDRSLRGSSFPTVVTAE